MVLRKLVTLKHCKSETENMAEKRTKYDDAKIVVSREFTIDDSACGVISACHNGKVNADIKSKGVDSSQSSDDAVESAKQLASTTGAVVVISGATDYVTDGSRVETIGNGSPLMTLVTAMGCTATSVVGAFAGVNPDAFEAALHGMAVMGVCGERAVAQKSAPGSLLTHFVDALYEITPEQLPRNGCCWF